MTEYADYTFYAGTYHGQLPETDFTRVSVAAVAALEQITLNRSATDAGNEKVKLAFCALCDAVSYNEQGELSSQTVGGWSKTYKSTGKSPERRLYDAAVPYLCGTGLLYRGLI